MPLVWSQVQDSLRNSPTSRQVSISQQTSQLPLSTSTDQVFSTPTKSPQPKASKPKSKSQTQAQEKDSLKQQLSKFYRIHDPSKIPNIETMMTKYSAEVIFKGIRVKYGEDAFAQVFEAGADELQNPETPTHNPEIPAKKSPAQQAVGPQSPQDNKDKEELYAAAAKLQAFIDKLHKKIKILTQEVEKREKYITLQQKHLAMVTKTLIYI